MTSGWVVGIGTTVLAYLLGTIPTAQIVASRLGRDPTTEGSNNPGASNVYRLVGWRGGVAVLLGDMAKGAVAAGGGWLAGGRDLAIVAGVAAVLGHVAPATRRFRGGKGVATAGGVALVVWPMASLVLIPVFVVAIRAVRIASVASLTIAVGLPVVVGLLGGPVTEILAAAAVALLVIARHHENIRRLVRGQEGQTTYREL